MDLLSTRQKLLLTGCEAASKKQQLEVESLDQPQEGAGADGVRWKRGSCDKNAAAAPRASRRGGEGSKLLMQSSR